MIAVENLTVSVGQFRLQGISIDIPQGAYGVLMGRTGCGKTTLLEAIAGLRPIESGTIRIGNCDVTQFDPATRGIGYVPQDAALFSTMTVRDHLGFALMIRNTPQREIDSRVDQLATQLEIQHLLSRRPVGLSGGERQRVALGRALASNPPVLLLDEPLSALDPSTRGNMQDLLRNIAKQTGVTILHVTHNAEEARQLATHRFHLEGTITPCPSDGIVPLHDGQPCPSNA
ncbi:MAG: ABC transporter ATP-binding protein [Planctomycetaceae bacterium]